MRVTIEFIARMANVSKATVSRVINNKAEGVGRETRLRVQKVIEEYGYEPNLLARGIATSHTKTIGLVIPDIMNPFFPALMKAVEHRARRSGYTVILCNSDSSEETEKKCILTLIANRVDGVILDTVLQEHKKVSYNLDKYNIPCALIDRRVKAIDYDVGVFVDNVYAFYIAVEYLIKHGNKRIAFIKGPADLSTTKERLEGYRLALKQHNIEIDPELIISGDFSYESGYEAILSLQKKGVEFTAVLASNDVMAFGALRAIEDIGRTVPDDVEVIGFDNIQFCEMIKPSLTTFEHPVSELGNKATELLIALIEGRKLKDKNIRLEAKMIKRESTR